MSTRARRGRPSSTTTRPSRTTTTNERSTTSQDRVGTAEVVAPAQRDKSFATICKEYKTLGGQVFKGTESFSDVQAWRIYYEDNLFKKYRT